MLKNIPPVMWFVIVIVFSLAIYSYSQYRKEVSVSRNITKKNFSDSSEEIRYGEIIDRAMNK